MMLLSETIRPEIPLTDYHWRRVEIIDHHDYTGVIRKVHERTIESGTERPQAWFEDGLLALKQYYAVALIDGRNMHAVSDRVDPFWHAHILHTRSYMEFCNRVVGDYMHHEPLDHANKVAVGRVSKLYEFTRHRYDEIFLYVDSHFNPSVLADAELICVHFGNTYPAADHAIYPVHRDAQPVKSVH